MWDEQKRSRFNQLCLQQEGNALARADQLELASLVQELEDAEAAYLTPAKQTLRRQRNTVEEQNRALETLARRKEALVKRLQDFLVDSQAERRAIESELATVLAESKGSEAKG